MVILVVNLSLLKIIYNSARDLIGGYDQKIKRKYSVDLIKSAISIKRGNYSMHFQDIQKVKSYSISFTRNTNPKYTFINLKEVNARKLRAT